MSANKIYTTVSILLFLPAAIFALLLHQPLIFLIPIAIVALFWMAHSLEGCFYVLLASLPWSIEYNFSRSLGTDLPDEPLMLLVSLVVLLHIIYHRRKQPLKGFASFLTLMIALQLLWMLITVFSSISPIVSLKFFLAKTWYLGSFVVAAFILWKDENIFRRSILILVLSMMAYTTLAIVRHAEYGFTFEKVNDALKPFFRNHVNYSAVLVCMLPPLIACYFLTAKRSHKRWVIILLLIAFVGLILSFARGAWLAMIVGGVAFWLVRKRLMSYAYILSIVFVGAFTFWLVNENRYLRFAHDYTSTIFHTNFQEHLVATYQFKDVSTAERFYRWVAGARMVKYKLATGFGPNTFPENYKSYAVPAFRTWVSANEDRSTIHNYFLLTIIEQGVIGLLLFLVLIGAMFYYAEKIYFRTNDKFWKTVCVSAAVILSMLCTVNFLSDLIETDKIGSIFFLCFTAIVIADIKTRSNPGTHLHRIS